MPAYMTSRWEQWDLEFKSEGTGIRRFIPIPYFSGTELSINIIVRNNSNEEREINFSGALSGADFSSSGMLNDYTTDSQNVSVNPKDKIKRKLQFRSLPQPGNYSVKLNLGLLGGAEPTQLGGRHGHCDIVYFDALPRDATITNWTVNILMLILGTLLGGLAGWIAGGMGS
jgi:hypothetical protein